MRRVAIALVHHPVLDARGEVVTSAFTNLDIHDLARSARTYGVVDYFVVHPITAQRDLVLRIKKHWEEGSSGKRIPARKDALALVRAVPSLADAYADFGGRESIDVWTTGAKDVDGSLAMTDARARIESDGKPVMIVFGTSWGLAREVHEGADARLAPIRPERVTAYNHLSVRAACAIVLDRLLGAR
jgi:hypothetical protein